MDFQTRFNFLMEITKMKSSELAKAAGVDNSVISLYKNGKRKKPRNKEALHRMVEEFTNAIKADYQKDAIASITGISHYNNYIDKKDFANHLYKWLNGEDVSENMISGTLTAKQDYYLVDTDTDIIPDNYSDSKNFQITYGNRGKYHALISMLRYLSTKEEPDTLYVSSNEDLNAYFSDAEDALRLQSLTRQLIDRGFKVVHILSTPTSTVRFMEDFLHWIPNYMTGMVESFYYPRIKDNIYHVTTIVSPKYMTLFSTTISTQAETPFSVLSTNPKILRAKHMEFMDYLSMCKPTMKVLRDGIEIHDCLKRFFSVDCAHIQKSISLSPETMPHELIVKNNHSEDFVGTVLTDGGNLNKKYLYTSIDICPLATSEQVKSGTVLMDFPSVEEDYTPIYYTPETYIKHLNNIIDTMDMLDNYYFVPIPYNPDDDENILVNIDKEALIIRSKSTNLVVDFNQPQLVLYLQEYLLNIANSRGYKLGKYRIKAQLKKLIKQLSV